LVQQYTDVFKYAREVVKIDDSKHMAYFYMGMASVEMGDTTKAIHNLQSSIEKNPDFIRGMDQLAYLYGLKGDYLAIDYYNNILNVDPNRSNTYFNIGTFYQAKKRYDLAISNYLAGLQLDPENAGMFYNLGFVYTELKEFDKAIHAFSNAIRIQPAYHEAYFARGYVYTQLGNTMKALEDYKSCVILKPGYPPALNEIERIEGK
jgi:tetratricopeptide (TPR) repeat protein